MFNDRVDDFVFVTKTDNKIVRYCFDVSFFPELTGTEKQVKWAISIRNKLMNTMKYTIFGRLGGDEFINAYGGVKSASKSFNNMVLDGYPGNLFTSNCEAYVTMTKLQNDKPDYDWHDFMKFIVSQKDARWWIKHRETLKHDSADEIIIGAMMSVLNGELKADYDEWRGKKHIAA